MGGEWQCAKQRATHLVAHDAKDVEEDVISLGLAEDWRVRGAQRLVLPKNLVQNCVEVVIHFVESRGAAYGPLGFDDCHLLRVRRFRANVCVHGW